ncbi:unnamed protein product [Amoebophrya sp. A120]|nr:unnamed protein product [Amoebophrya sp. A120]|eukprot:GSA120T00008853001.1
MSACRRTSVKKMSNEDRAAVIARHGTFPYIHGTIPDKTLCTDTVPSRRCRRGPWWREGISRAACALVAATMLTDCSQFNIVHQAAASSSSYVPATTTAFTSPVLEDLRPARLNSVHDPYLQSCGCHIHYELWVRTSFDMHQILVPDLPELMAKQDLSDPRFLTIRDLILKNSNDCPKGDREYTEEDLLHDEEKQVGDADDMITSLESEFLEEQMGTAAAPPPSSAGSSSSQEKEKQQKMSDATKKRIANEIDATGITIAENSFQVMFNQKEKAKWTDPGYVSDCVPGHIAVLMNCALQAVLLKDEDSREPGKFGLQRNLRHYYRYMQLANYQIPLVTSCLDRSVWGYDVEEFYDNYRNLVLTLTDLSGELERRTGTKKSLNFMDASPKLLQQIIWRSRENRQSEARFFNQKLSVTARRTSASRTRGAAQKNSYKRGATPPLQQEVDALTSSDDQDQDEPFLTPSPVKTCSSLSTTSTSALISSESDTAAPRNKAMKKSRHCGQEHSPSPGSTADRDEKTQRLKKSKLSFLSSTKCATLVENACIHGNQLHLFGLTGEEKRDFTALRTCGEFGNYWFTNLVFDGDIDPGTRRLSTQKKQAFQSAMCNNATSHYTDTLYVVTAMMAGVSEGNPYHLLHLTAPAFYQLQAEEYGICADPFKVDIRFEFPNQKQEEKMNHFWRVLTGQYKKSEKHNNLPYMRLPDQTQVDILEMIQGNSQAFDQGGIVKFWWSLLSYNPPIPLGQDLKPRCYERIVFGREPLRTGIGGFVTSRIFNFMLTRVHEEFSSSTGTSNVGQLQEHQKSTSAEVGPIPHLPHKNPDCPATLRNLDTEEEVKAYCYENVHRNLFMNSNPGKNRFTSASKLKTMSNSLVRCCSVEWDYYRRMLWSKVDEDIIVGGSTTAELPGDHHIEVTSTGAEVTNDMQHAILAYQHRYGSISTKTAGAVASSSSNIRANSKNPHDCDFFRDHTCLHEFPRTSLPLKDIPGAGAPRTKANDDEGHQQEEVEEVSTLYRFENSTHPVETNLVIVQRQKKAKRTFENLSELLAFLSSVGKVAVLVVYLEQITPTTQYFLARQADIWMGATGAANAWAVFMKPGSILLDTFPPLNGFCDRGWNMNPVTHFGGLTRLNGKVHHNCEVHKSNNGESRWYMIKQYIAEYGGGFWHSQNIFLDMRKFAKLWEEAQRVLNDEILPPQVRFKSATSSFDDTAGGIIDPVAQQHREGFLVPGATNEDFFEKEEKLFLAEKLLEGTEREAETFYRSPSTARREFSYYRHNL